MNRTDTVSVARHRCGFSLCLIAVWAALMAVTPLAGQYLGQSLGTFTPSSPSFPSPNALTAICPIFDQYGNQIGLYTDCPVVVSVTPLQDTNLHRNGHLHEGPPGIPTAHPVSTLSTSASFNCGSSGVSSVSGYTDSTSGYFTFTLCPTLIGQYETLTVAGPGGSTSYPYLVGYTGLEYAQYASWVLVGATDSPVSIDTGHGDNLYNHWMTTDTYNDLVSATNLWILARGNCKICVNDAALPYGGKFDIYAIKIDPDDGLYHPWASPHAAHDRGSAVDISTTTNECNYPVDKVQFLNFCKQSGFSASFSIQEGNHVHCNSLDPRTYAH